MLREARPRLKICVGRVRADVSRETNGFRSPRTPRRISWPSSSVTTCAAHRRALGVDELSFCSNDYLGLASRPAPAATSGAGASRLIAGERDEHRRLERRSRRGSDAEDALAFSSGYAANVGTLSALAGPGDLLVSDALNHASIIDGARLSRARVVVVPHGDADAVASALDERTEARAWVVVESYFSMDADGPDLAALRAHLRRARRGSLRGRGPRARRPRPGGRGAARRRASCPDVLVGTLGKAFGAGGVRRRAAPSSANGSGTEPARSCSRRASRLSPRPRPCAPSSGVIEHPELYRAGRRAVRSAPRRPRSGRCGRGRAHVHRRRTDDGSGPSLLGFGHMVPIVARAPRRALRWAERTPCSGIHAQAIRPPTVPTGSLAFVSRSPRSTGR